MGNFAVKVTDQDSCATGQVVAITASNTILHFVQNATSAIIKHTASGTLVWFDIL